MTRSKIAPASTTVRWDRIGTAPTLPEHLITVIESKEVLYVQFNLNFENSSVSWLHAPGVTDSYLDVSGSTAHLQLALQNIDSLPSGNYKATLTIDLSNAEGFVRTMTSEINLVLTGISPTQITTDKTNYNVLYVRSTNSYSGETTVSIINNDELDTLTFESVSSTLFLEGSLTDALELVEDPAFPFVSNAELPVSGTKLVACRLKKAGFLVASFTVTITVINTDELIASPLNFDFNLRKGFNETQSSVLNINNPLGKSFTITKPSWLTLSASAGSASANITVTTSNSDSFTVGNYTGMIVISYDAKTIEIPVTLAVSSFVDIALQEHNFCLDDVILKASRMNENGRFVRITLQMVFKTTEGSHEIASNYILPYFDGKISTDVGEKIQHYFPVFQNHLFGTNPEIFDNQLIYKAASVVMIIEEIDISYNVLHSLTLSAADFYAGNRPALFPLFTNVAVRRTYPDSKYFFSYHAELSGPEDFTLEPVEGNPVASKEVHAVMLNDTLLDNSVLKGALGVEIITLPDEQKRATLQYLNNNLVPDWFICSGEYDLTDDFDHVYDDFMLNGQKYESTEKQKLTINTGFILKEEVKTIIEIIKSPLSFIELEDEIYRCFNISAKITETENDRNLINYKLEFIIVK